MEAESWCAKFSKKPPRHYCNMKQVKQKLLVAFISLGLSAPAAFVAYDLTLPAEGLETRVYTDPVGLPTVCVGHMDKSLEIGKEYTLEQCVQMFAYDWKRHQEQLNAVVKVPYKSDWQKEALTDFTFNLGIGNVQSSTLLRLLNQGKHREACLQLTRWVKAKGKTLKGLVIRRDKTMPYCMGELSWDKQKEYERFREEYEKVSKELETKAY